MLKYSSFIRAFHNSKLLLNNLTSLRNENNSIAQPTIYALSTHLARSAIGVVRISGPNSKFILEKLSEKPTPKPRKASVRKLYHPTDKVLLDEALTLYFKEPKSYTGEDLVELHLHGGIAVIKAVIKAIQALHTEENPIRYAEAGEFTRKSFQNGRFDLTEIEGIKELINAETEVQRIGAINSAMGNNRLRFHRWRELIVHNVGMLSAIIDFADDTEIEDVESIFKKVSNEINELSFEINNFLNKSLKSNILLDGIKVTLIGPPNAGKSSILNILANDDASIVSDVAGTTRDVINVPIDINGYKVIATDTAGIRNFQEADKIEIEGIKRAKTKSFQGDLILMILSCDNQIDDSMLDHFNELRANGCEFMIVLNKMDLLDKSQQLKIIKELSLKLNISPDDILKVSCKDGFGISQLNDALLAKFKNLTLTDLSTPLILSERVQDILKNDVLYGFEQFNHFKEVEDAVMAAEALHHSIEGIGKITGQSVDVEELLGVVFSNFCVGK